MAKKKVDRETAKKQAVVKECDLDCGYISPITTIHNFSLENIKSVLGTSRYLQVLIVITVLGLFLRFYNLGFNSLWLDETATYSFSVRTLTEIWWETAVGGETNPPLFYWIEHFMLMLGNNEVILRFIPALFGVLSIPLFYLVGKEFFDRNVGIIAAAGCAFSPFLIYYSQDARTYAMMLFFVALSTLFFLKALKSGTLTDWGLFGVFSAFAFWSHFYTFVMTAALVLYTLIIWAPHIRTEIKNLKMLSVGIVVFIILSLPLILIALQIFKMSTASSPTWGIQGLNFIAVTLYRISGFNIHQISGFNILSMVVLLTLFLIGFVQAFLLDKNKGIFLAFIMVFTLVISYFLSFKMPMDSRYLIFLSIVFFIGIAMSYRAMYTIWSSRGAVYIIIAILVLVSVPVLVNYYSSYSNPDWRGFSTALAEKTRPGDLVISVPKSNSLLLDYYYSSAKSQTREYRANSAEDLEKIYSVRGNSTMYFVLTRAISALNPNGDAVAWLENNTHFAGMDTTKSIYLFTSPKRASAPNYNMTIIIPSEKEASNIGAIIKEINANFFSGTATNWEILIVVNNSPDGTLLTGPSK